MQFSLAIGDRQLHFTFNEFDSLEHSSTREMLAPDSIPNFA